MNETTCWGCKKIFTYDGEKYRDVDCLHCGLLNSIYNPADFVPLQPEERENGEF